MTSGILACLIGSGVEGGRRREDNGITKGEGLAASVFKQEKIYAYGSQVIILFQFYKPVALLKTTT